MSRPKRSGSAAVSAVALCRGESSAPKKRELSDLRVRRNDRSLEEAKQRGLIGWPPWLLLTFLTSFARARVVPLIERGDRRCRGREGRLHRSRRFSAPARRSRPAPCLQLARRSPRRPRRLCASGERTASSGFDPASVASTRGLPANRSARGRRVCRLRRPRSRRRDPRQHTRSGLPAVEFNPILRLHSDWRMIQS